MASAQTEPSMDEILASIRRIISEEDEGTPEVPVRKKLEALELTEETAGEAEADAAEEIADEASVAEASEAVAEPAPAPEAPEAPETPGGSDHVSETDTRAATDTAGAAEADALDDFEPLPEEPAAAEASMEPAAVAHDAGEVQDETFDAPTPDGVVAEAAPQAAPTGQPARDDVAVSDAVASVAAGAFGALEENMRLSAGSGRTIEDLVEAMLRPMLKDWLEANLPRIVEEKVEEEVRRIARRR